MLNKLINLNVEPQDERLLKIYKVLKGNVSKKAGSNDSVKRIVVHDGHIQ
jgi:hypothetical protein